MKTSLSNEQIQKYRDDGFLSYPGLLTPTEVAELKGAILEEVSRMAKKNASGSGANTAASDNYNSKIFTQCLNIWRLSKIVKNHLQNPALGKMLCQLEGVEGIRVWHDQALIKEPFSNATAWHLDNPFWSFSSHHAIQIWIALEDATPFNGCMCFIPGTQKLATFDSSPIGQNMGDLFKIYPKMGEIDPVPVPMKAGDCSFHNGLVAHGAGANMTRGRRIAMTCAYMPEGSTFNGQRNILPADYFNSLKIGDVLENEEQNPLVYSTRKPVAV